MRAIVVDRNGSASGFLSTVAIVCKEHGIMPVVLTMARSEAEALARQTAAKNVLAAIGIQGEFDYVVGADIVSAISWSARWRKCSHAFISSMKAGPWWRLWRRKPKGRLVDLSSALTMITINDLESTIDSQPCQGGAQ